MLVNIIIRSTSQCTSHLSLFLPLLPLLCLLFLLPFFPFSSVSSPVFFSVRVYHILLNLKLPKSLFWKDLWKRQCQFVALAVMVASQMVAREVSMDS